MNTLFASNPLASTPAMNTPDTFVCMLSGSCLGIPVSAFTTTPSDASNSVLGVNPVMR